VHGNAPLTPQGRLRLCRRIEDGWPVAHAAASMGISRDRAYVWWRRFQAEGIDGLEDRSSRPRHSPTQLKRRLERKVVSLRRNRGLGPARIAGIMGLHASTTHRVLVRHGLNRLDHLDRLTREPIRRFEIRPGRICCVLSRSPWPAAPTATREPAHGPGQKKRIRGIAQVHRPATRATTGAICSMWRWLTVKYEIPSSSRVRSS
jgi:transposase-like protein